MGNAFRKVKTGDQLRIPASAYNAFVDAALDLRGRQQNRGQTAQPGSEGRSGGIILVRNDSDPVTWAIAS